MCFAVVHYTTVFLHLDPLPITVCITVQIVCIKNSLVRYYDCTAINLGKPFFHIVFNKGQDGMV